MIYILEKPQMINFNCLETVG